MIITEIPNSDKVEEINDKSIPHSERFVFLLLSREQAEKLRFCRDGFLSLQVSSVSIEASDAYVVVWCRWLRGRHSETKVGGSMEYKLAFRKEGSEWLFDGILWLQI
jgi:hypothetical protein